MKNIRCQHILVRSLRHCRYSTSSNPSSPPPPYQFKVSVAYQPKYRSIRQPRLDPDKTIATTSKVWPTKDRPNSGHDSFFQAWLPNGTVALGVADGVGDWVTRGVDPSEFSHSLCEKMSELFVESSSENGLSPLRLLSDAYYGLLQEARIKFGSSTACIGKASSLTGQLQVANVGDSGYSIYRRGRVYRQSKPQSHSFNVPYQLGIQTNEKSRDSVDLKHDHYKKSAIRDEPSNADLSSHTLQHGDVVIFATDGLYDNLFTQEILSIITDKMIQSQSWVINQNEEIEPSPQNILSSSLGDELATALVRRSVNSSLDLHHVSPFYQELSRHMNINRTGG